MSFHYSPRSKNRLAECHPNLQLIFNDVIKVVDCSIVTGRRGKDAQDAAYNSGKSKVKWPNSMHNQRPSLAVDVAPYPIDWEKTRRFYYLAGIVKGIASLHGINVRWGGDWDGDNDFADNDFNDLLHFELTEC